MSEYQDSGFYQVHRYVLMPDHLHAILTPRDSTSLEKAVQLIKGGSSHEIGKRFGCRFPVWQPGFTEHEIRDRADYDGHVIYIDQNPVKTRSVARPEEYRFCSAYGKYKPDPWSAASGAEAQLR